MELFSGEGDLQFSIHHDHGSDEHVIRLSGVTPREICKISVVFTYNSGKQEILSGKDIARGGDWRLKLQEKVKKIELICNLD